MKRSTILTAVVMAVLLCGCAQVTRRPITFSAESAERLSKLAADTLDALAAAHVAGKITKAELDAAADKYDKVVALAKQLGNAYATAASLIEIGSLDPEDPAYQATMLRLQGELAALVADLLEKRSNVEVP